MPRWPPLLERGGGAPSTLGPRMLLALLPVKGGGGELRRGGGGEKLRLRLRRDRLE